jgi:hypothetical protein
MLSFDLTETAALFNERDQLRARLAALDAKIADAASSYGREQRIYGFAPQHMRQALNARGLLA